jgi:hypothetical protein
MSRTLGYHRRATLLHEPPLGLRHQLQSAADPKIRIFASIECLLAKLLTSIILLLNSLVMTLVWTLVLVLPIVQRPIALGFALKELRDDCATVHKPFPVFINSINWIG